MSTELAERNANGQGHAPAPLDPAILENVMLNGDVSKLTAPQRIAWYKARCEAAGLDPRAQPFQYLTLQGRQVLYATKACTDQLTGLHKLSVEVRNRTVDDATGVLTVDARVTFPDGRYVEDTGALCLAGLKGEALANAVMKCTTKAKRRAILSACGLGMLDETEVETIPGARTTPADAEALGYDPEPPARDSGLTPGGSPAGDRAFLDWLVPFCREKNARWADYWSNRFRDDCPDGIPAEFLPEFKLSGHLAKWYGGGKGMTNNHKLRLLAVKFASEPERLVGEATAYARREFAVERDKVVAKLGLRPDDEDEPQADPIPPDEDDLPRPIVDREPGEDDD